MTVMEQALMSVKEFADKECRKGTWFDKDDFVKYTNFYLSMEIISESDDKSFYLAEVTDAHGDTIKVAYWGGDRTISGGVPPVLSVIDEAHSLESFCKAIFDKHELNPDPVEEWLAKVNPMTLGEFSARSGKARTGADFVVDQMEMGWNYPGLKMEIMEDEGWQDPRNIDRSAFAWVFSLSDTDDETNWFIAIEHAVVEPRTTALFSVKENSTIKDFCLEVILGKRDDEGYNGFFAVNADSFVGDFARGFIDDIREENLALIPRDK